ncbi:phosphoglycerate mutase family protein [Paenibacillus doosanensis]|uniref:histidine phosphatase family protein n=1 Tax=Paenibacillus doosanensis TaxID=1229154 RepID=UPI00217F620A|nr:histidine phosphatase family protein [Paenibacillus doosanensis]MCS7462718.1 phosphoglycerate mutase family protein [Paenibacillus doosanensis]
MTLFYLVRHGEPQWELNERYKLKGHGRDLVPLTANGVNQVYMTAKDKRLQEAELIVSSPYPRALQTAAILSKELQLEVIVEFDLREWQPDLTFEYDSLDRLKELGDDFDQNNGIYPPGETRLWESKESLKHRVGQVIGKYSNYSKVIITGHGMAFRTLIGEIGEIPHASVIEFRSR